MCHNDDLPTLIAASLLAAQRRPGWNNRSGRIERFNLGNCQLIVVPCKRWVYRWQEQQAAAWCSEQEARR
ncbi:hypothetical protein [Dyella thiooxydans]|uniref:hypothetical protein n=1 Tax=Dyella thiooxydans TaxID=445710 RepID=UPI000A623CDB|nr:hypothetical protein [Dyella thiooxydans]